MFELSSAMRIPGIKRSKRVTGVQSSRTYREHCR
jgi:hypothetical protein